MKQKMCISFTSAMDLRIRDDEGYVIQESSVDMLPQNPNWEAANWLKSNNLREPESNLDPGSLFIFILKNIIFRQETTNNSMKSCYFTNK